VFAGIRKQGCVPPRQILKAAVDYRNLGTVPLRFCPPWKVAGIVLAG